MTLPREPGHRKSTVPDAAPLPVNTSQGGWSLGSKKHVPAHGDGSSQLPLGKLEVKIQSSQGKVILKGSCSSLNPQSPPPLTSAAGQLGATRRACQEAPSQGAKLCRAGSGSLAPSKESKQGRREAVESEKLQQVRACEAGASRRDITRRVWLPAGRPFRSPKLLLAAPRPGVFNAS